MGKSNKASHKSAATSPSQLIRYFVVNYPIALSLSVIGLFVAGLAESFGIATLLPLLGELTGSKVGLPPPLNRIIDVVFDLAGVTPSTQTLLVIVVGLIVARVVLTSCVMIFVGRISSIATADFRIRALEALSGARWSYFVSQKTGKPATAIANNASRAGQGLMILCQLIASASQAALLAVFASLISWGATVLAVLVGGVTAVCLTWLAITHTAQQSRSYHSDRQHDLAAVGQSKQHEGAQGDGGGGPRQEACAARRCLYSAQ